MEQLDPRPPVPQTQSNQIKRPNSKIVSPNVLYCVWGPGGTAAMDLLGFHHMTFSLVVGEVRQSRILTVHLLTIPCIRSESPMTAFRRTRRLYRFPENRRGGPRNEWLPLVDLLKPSELSMRGSHQS